MNYKIYVLFIYFTLVLGSIQAQINWSAEGDSYYRIEENEIVKYALPANERSVVLDNQTLTLKNGEVIEVRAFYPSTDGNKILIYTNSARVWRLDTQGDYYVLDRKENRIQKIGASLPPSSLRFAKFSPDASKIAYVSEFNLYVEDLNTSKITAITQDGDRKLIYGTFDWAYEEEFSCRDGFQWSPDSKRIAYWQIDARQIADYNMISLIDSVYSRVIPVEYPTVGQDPSPAKIGVVELASQNTTWLDIEGDPRQNYLTRLEWNSDESVFVQQLNRKQNHSKIWSCDVVKNKAELIFEEKDEAWIDVLSVWENTYTLMYRHKFHWINKNNEFLWISEKDGWRHIYRIGKNGDAKKVTFGEYDVMNIAAFNEKENVIYFHASPENATQKYLYKTKLDGSSVAEMVTPMTYVGTNDYDISPSGQFAFHRFQNAQTVPISQLVSLPEHKANTELKGIDRVRKGAKIERKIEFFTVKIEDGTEMDAWMVKPKNFDESKKYPVVFYVYTEPWGANVKDVYSAGFNQMYDGDMAEDGYIYMSIDNRGTPAPKGRAWRKSIYRQIGRLNISDQAAAAKEILKWDFIDAERIAVWGWSGGGTATLNLMFQYPEIYKTGVAVAAVVNQLTYDNIYQERYMGLPQENLEDFVAGSPITHAKNLEGNLLYIHGTGDDNVHYNNAEMLVDELIKHNKQFQFMPYPNRSHSMREGEGTRKHLMTMYSNYLRQHCPPGGR